MKLENIGNDLNSLNEAIQAAKFKDDVNGIQDEFLKCEEYDDKIIECQAMLNANNDASGMSDANSSLVGTAPRSRLKCPTAPLPRFTSSTGENVELFLDQFDEIISKFDYTDYDKFLLLKEQISGRAHEGVAAFQRLKA